MSLYADYLAEITQKHMEESPTGFAIYQFFGKECYIEDIYVLPEYRQTKEASRLADLIAVKAKALGCTHLTGTTDARSKSVERSNRVLEAYGMKLYKKDGPVSYFTKEIL